MPAETRQVVIRLPTDLLTRAQRYATEIRLRTGLDMTRTAALQSLLVRALDALEPRQEDKPRRREGASLVKGSDAGGVRWFLDGRPVQAGTGLELATLDRLGRCETCEGEGLTRGGETCAACGGAGDRTSTRWTPVRFETSGDTAWLYLRTHGVDFAAPVPAGARLRWRD